MNTRVCTSEPRQSSSRGFSSFKDSSNEHATEQMNGQLHKSEVLLITTTMFVVRAENISQKSSKMHIAILFIAEIKFLEQ